MSTITDTYNFLRLYQEITKAESRNEKTNQEVIQRFNFHYSQVKNEQLLK